MADEYKDPNTDIMKALSKAVDAATGETGTQYEYKNPNTDIIQKLEELIEAIATSGGGGSSGDYIHELLWDYVNDNSGTIPFGTYSVTLAESIDKYDCISICFKSDYSDAGNWGQCSLFLIDVNTLKTNPMHANYFNYTSFGERSSAFYLSGKTLQKIIDNINNTNGLVAVYGIKYG